MAGHVGTITLTGMTLEILPRLLLYPNLYIAKVYTGISRNDYRR